MAKYLNLQTFLISSYIIRLLITGANIGDAFVILVLGAIYCGHVYLEHIKEPEANAELKEKVSQMDERLTTVKHKVDGMTLATSLKR